MQTHTNIKLDSNPFHWEWAHLALLAYNRAELGLFLIALVKCSIAFSKSPAKATQSENFQRLKSYIPSEIADMARPRSSWDFSNISSVTFGTIHVHINMHTVCIPLIYLFINISHFLRRICIRWNSSFIIKF